MRRLEEEVNCKENFTDVKCKYVGDMNDFKAVYINNNLVSSIDGSRHYQKEDIMSLLVGIYKKLDTIHSYCDEISERVYVMESKLSRMEKIIDVECAPGGELESSISNSYILDAWKNDQ